MNIPKFVRIAETAEAGLGAVDPASKTPFHDRGLVRKRFAEEVTIWSSAFAQGERLTFSSYSFLVSDCVARIHSLAARFPERTNAYKLDGGVRVPVLVIPGFQHHAVQVSLAGFQAARGDDSRKLASASVGIRYLGRPRLEASYTAIAGPGLVSGATHYEMYGGPQVHSNNVRTITHLITSAEAVLSLPGVDLQVSQISQTA